MTGTVDVTSYAVLNLENLTNFQIPALVEQVVISGTKLTTITVAVPTSDTAIDLSAAGTFGRCWIQSQDTVNYVDYGATVAGAIAPMGRLNPKERHQLRMKPGITLRMQAHTAAVTVLIFLLDD